MKVNQTLYPDFLVCTHRPSGCRRAGGASHSWTQAKHSELSKGEAIPASSGGSITNIIVGG